MQDLFPNGVTSYALGGLMLGAGIALVYAGTGRVAGLSSFFTAVHSFWSRRPFFRAADVVAERWKLVLVAGLVLGALAWTFTVGEPFHTHVSLSRLFVGGVLVGFGTRTSRGCTSGHGICGVSAGAAPSLASTATFMGVGILTAHLIAAFGGGVG